MRLHSLRQLREPFVSVLGSRSCRSAIQLSQLSPLPVLINSPGVVFVFGIGVGWNAEEVENHGIHYGSRFKILRERVLAMQALWTQDKAEFHGEFVAFDLLWLYPKPKQKPYPPILLGGESDHTLRRVVKFGNGWLPRSHGEFDPDRAVARLRQAAAAAGRDPTTFSITVFNAPADEAVLASYREAGIHRVLLEVPDRGRDEVLRLLDRNAPLARALI